MAIVPLPPPARHSSGAAAPPPRARRHRGRETTGRTIIQLAVDDRVVDKLMSFDAEAANLEPQPDDEEDGPPVVVELVRPKTVEQR